jgi:hypothetical protein
MSSVDVRIVGNSTKCLSNSFSSDRYSSQVHLSTINIEEEGKCTGSIIKDTVSIS